ncbi:hypothetical protein [Helicobacter sp. MIT 05-5294]|uniref:hypothetical protein n=1 Tax=Helicobacter sp. MIT 05-5294 TaxID=1548150 RepID=UPI0010FD25C9|nr:hypothetical protein [Helicobacter sp. MIT 05-5294]TLD85891.1 hypothetical protein LS69_007445 [Helicobacter sp. MIT 05-5294]
MAISFQNNPFLNTFNNPFANEALNNLKPRIKQNNAQTDENKVKSNATNQTAETAKNPIDSLRANLTNKVLGGLLNFGLQNAKNNVVNLQNLRQLPDEMKPKEEQNAPKDKSLDFKNPLEMLDSAITTKNAKNGDLDILSNLRFLNGEKVGETPLKGLENVQIVPASSIEVQESITYTISYDSATGQYAQSLSYTSSLVANFDSEITDKNGNTFVSKTQLVMGKSLESQITGSAESVNDALKGFLEGQKFALEYDGELDGESFKNSGLDNMLLVMDSTNNAISNAFQEILSQKNDFGRIYGRSDEEVALLFESLHNVLSSSLEVFLGIGKEVGNQQDSNTSSNLKGFNSREFNISITTAKLGLQNAEEQNPLEWKAKKMDIESLEIFHCSSAGFSANSFTLNA